MHIMHPDGFLIPAKMTFKSHNLQKTLVNVSDNVKRCDVFWGKELALGCVNEYPGSFCLQEASSRNLGPTLKPDLHTPFIFSFYCGIPLPFPLEPTLFPDTPLHSSETPRSSSLYQPESDDEFRARAGEGNAAASARDRQEEEGGGCDDNDSDGVSEDVSEDIAAAIETDHRRPSSPSESVSAEEVLESEAAAQEDEQEEES